MSVLSFPRIYFKGFMEWDPCTFNNNDWSAFQTYNATGAALNWSYLYQLQPPITQANLASTFRPWAISLQDDDSDSPSGKRVPAEWNMFGTHGVRFVQYEDKTTIITGGLVGYNQPATNDPIIGGPVVIHGDIGGQGQNPGRLVDTNPVSPWSSQIYFGQLVFGSGTAAFSGPRAYRMHSRWLNPFRIYSQASSLTAPASSIGVCFQTCIPFGEMTWPAAGASPLVATLQQAASQPGALGVMVRFTAYVNLYFMNGILNGIGAQPRDYPSLATALAAAWEAWNQSGDTSKFFSNPCYSHVVGTIGVWNDGELASVPGGRWLAPATPVSPQSGSDVVRLPPRIMGHELKANISNIAGSANPVLLGPAAANVDYDAQLISLDFSGAIPELGTPGAWPSNLTKANFGQLTLGVMTDGNFTPVTTIDYNQYQRSAYEASAGIIDIPFPNSSTGALLQSGALAIQVPSNPSQPALLEQSYTAETDTRGIYLDQNGQAEFQVMVCQKGTPSAGASVLLAQYDSNLNLVPSNQTQFVEFLNGNVMIINAGGIVTFVTILTTDGSGNAIAGIGAQNAGFPVIAFFPYSDGDALPQPPPTFNFIDNAFYTTVRVLPFDDLVPQSFVDLWNASQDQAAAWNFIYGQILYVYDMLFNVMLEYVNLGDQQAVEGSIGSIWSAISQESAMESTYAMPITRDMSAGKRLTLQLWIYLVANQYNVPNLNVGSIPAGWTPPS
jgi:hypothetical protein